MTESRSLATAALVACNVVVAGLLLRGWLVFRDMASSPETGPKARTKAKDLMGRWDEFEAQGFDMGRAEQDICGTLRDVFEAYLRVVWYKAPIALPVGPDAVVLDKGNAYGEGLTRVVWIPPTGGVVETIGDVVPYVRVRYCMVQGHELNLGISEYVGETVFEPLGNGHVRVHWRCLAKPLRFWPFALPMSFVFHYFLREIKRQVVKEEAAKKKKN